MSPAKIGLSLVLAAFLSLTGWALVTGGGFGALLDLHVSNPWAVQIFCDLVVSLSIVCVFIWRDARERGTSPWPWLVATLFTGSIAPLTYFLVRSGIAGAPGREQAVHTA